MIKIWDLRSMIMIWETKFSISRVNIWESRANFQAEQHFPIEDVDA